MRNLAFRLALRPASAVALLAFVACEPALVGEAGGEGAPAAVLTLSVSAGQAPLDVVLDASASSPFKAGTALKFDFDFDGDGTFDVEGNDDGIIEHTYSAGSFNALVRVRGEDGRYDVAEQGLIVEGENPPRTADVDVDSDHDGAITASDEAVEDTEQAAFFGNVDDDDGDGERDRDDKVLDAEDDDTFAVIVRRVRELGAGSVFVEVTPAIAAQRTRLWRDGEILTDITTPRAEVAGLGSGDVELRLEATTGRTSDWDGVVNIKVTLEDDAGVVSTDIVKLRAAPVIFPDNLQAPRALYVVDLPDGQDNNRALLASFREALPADVTLNAVSGDDFFGDRWLQDNWEVGTQVMKNSDGSVREMITAMQTERYYGGQGLDAFVPGAWVSAGRGFYYPSGDETSHNYGGNLETSSPTEQDPFGRMLFGGGTTTLSGANNPDTMNSSQVAFLNAQELQGPAIELSSEWLAVGHIDEIFQFVPDLTPDEGGHNFKIAIASPRMARDVLVALQAEGQGSAVIFSGRSSSYTVDEVVDAPQFNALNELAQARIDAVQERLKTTLGLDDNDFRPVPVLYEEASGDGLVAAFNPGIQNLVTVGDRVFAPDPEGPIVNGSDAWQAATLASLADTDLDVIFVDVFESYHELMGEAHCGTNLEREPYATDWWTVKE